MTVRLTSHLLWPSARASCTFAHHTDLLGLLNCCNIEAHRHSTIQKHPTPKQEATRRTQGHMKHRRPHHKQQHELVPTRRHPSLQRQSTLQQAG